MFALRLATVDDIAEVLPRTRAFNALESIVIDPATHESALRRLLGDPSLGGVWLVERAGVPVGYAIVTFGFDLEFGGRDSYLTELWIDPDARGRGAGTVALTLLESELGSRDVRALHLQVRSDNPAVRLYERTGFITSLRRVMTRRLG